MAGFDTLLAPQQMVRSYEVITNEYALIAH